MQKVELKSVKEKGKTSKSVKNLSIDKTKIPLTDEEYDFIKQKIDEHVEKHGIAYGFIYNLFLKEEAEAVEE